jgi:hypothetical protein
MILAEENFLFDLGLMIKVIGKSIMNLSRGEMGIAL